METRQELQDRLEKEARAFKPDLLRAMWVEYNIGLMDAQSTIVQLRTQIEGIYPRQVVPDLAEEARLQEDKRKLRRVIKEILGVGELDGPVLKWDDVVSRSTSVLRETED